MAGVVSQSIELRGGGNLVVLIVGQSSILKYVSVLIDDEKFG